MINLLEDKWRTRHGIFPYIVQLGTGATGSYTTQMVAQMMSIFKQDGFYLIADPDVIEEKNLKNQFFIKQDIGKKKADVLAKRYSAAYDLQIASYSEDYIEDYESLKMLFSNNHLKISDDVRYDVLFLPVIIGCVDNNYTRAVIHEFFERAGRCLYIDVGNSAASVPSDFGIRPMTEWTDDESKSYEESGWDGQVVCGLKLQGETILPPVAEVFPDILSDKDEIAPSQLACSNIVANDPQRLLTNRMAAMSVATYLNELFQSGTISNHMTFFHAKKAYMKSIEVKQS
ncbi:ThiF family adenylyltransferase [Oceanobacillus luteolus]|uniref:ThiF family adenylyltransferase n=1 Tax=Oceanobacillus luteolus TaxID=1274358 RepID=A0ABW4HVU8_9BACI